MNHATRQAESLDRDRLLAWLRQQKSAGMTNQTLNHYIRHISMLLKFRQEKPVEYVKAYKHFVHRVLKDDEVERILRAAGSSRYTAPRDTAIVRILFCTGIRLGEFAGMKISSICRSICSLPVAISMKSTTFGRRMAWAMRLPPMW